MAILLNYSDLTFAKIEIDVKSIAYFETNLRNIKDSLLRAMVWRTYYEMVRDCKITSKKYCEFIIKNIEYEQSDPIL